MKANVPAHAQRYVSYAISQVYTGLLLPGTTVTRVNPRGEWAASDARLHRPGRVRAVWTDFGTFYAGWAMCGLQLPAIRLFVEPPDMDLCDACLFAGEHVVYRYFDINGALIYVGYTASLIKRMNDHRRHAQWWPLVYRAEYEALPSEKAAREVETRAIETENPIANVPTGSVDVRRQLSAARAERLSQLIALAT